MGANNKIKRANNKIKRAAEYLTRMANPRTAQVNLTVTIKEASLVLELLENRAFELRNDVVKMNRQETKEYNLIEPLIEQIQSTLDSEKSK